MKRLIKRDLLIFSIFMVTVAFCAIVYELLIADVLSYLLGDSVLYFSITIGLFLSSMGIGSFISYKIADMHKRLTDTLILTELLLGIVGGFSIFIIFLISSFSIVYYRTYPGSFLGSTIPLHIASFLIIIAIGVLVGLEIPLVTRIVTKKSGLKYSLATILAADYIGSFIGSLLFPLLLLPFLGVIKTSFLIGMLNTTIILLLLFFYKITYYRWYLAGIFLLLVILGSLFLQSNSIEYYFDKKLYTYDENSVIVERIQSPYQKIVLTKRKIGDNEFITLFLNGLSQFDSERDSTEYHELLVHPAFALAKDQSSVLILGGGDGLPAKEVLRHLDVKRIVNVDIDPVIIKFSQTNDLMKKHNNYSFLNQNIELIAQDAFIYVKRSREKFDIILLDFPEGNDVALSKSYSLQFIRELEAHLKEGGIIVFHVDVFDSKIFYNVLKTLHVSGLHFIAMPQIGYGSFEEREISLNSEDAIIFVSRDAIDPDSFDQEAILKYFTYKDSWKFSFLHRMEERDIIERLMFIRPNTIYRPNYLHYYRQDFFGEYDVGL